MACLCQAGICLQTISQSCFVLSCPLSNQYTQQNTITKHSKQLFAVRSGSGARLLLSGLSCVMGVWACFPLLAHVLLWKSSGPLWGRALWESAEFTPVKCKEQGSAGRFSAAVKYSCCDSLISEKGITCDTYRESLPHLLCVYFNTTRSPWVILYLMFFMWNSTVYPFFTLVPASCLIWGDVFYLFNPSLLCMFFQLFNISCPKHCLCRYYTDKHVCIQEYFLGCLWKWVCRENVIVCLPSSLNTWFRHLKIHTSFWLLNFIVIWLFFPTKGKGWRDSVAAPLRALPDLAEGITSLVPSTHVYWQQPS